MGTLFILNDPPYGTERSYNALRLAGSRMRSWSTAQSAAQWMSSYWMWARAMVPTPSRPRYAVPKSPHWMLRPRCCRRRAHGQNGVACRSSSAKAMFSISHRGGALRCDAGGHGTVLGEGCYNGIRRACSSAGAGRNARRGRTRSLEHLGRQAETSVSYQTDVLVIRAFLDEARAASQAH